MGKIEQFEVADFDPIEVGTLLTDISQSYATIAAQRLEQGWDSSLFRDDLGLLEAFSSAKVNMLFEPLHLAEQQLQFWYDTNKLWQTTMMDFMGYSVKPVIAPLRSDHRFRDGAWEDNPLFKSIKQAYLLAARYLHSAIVSGANGLDDHTARKVDFFTRQFIDAIAPTNFLATNPEVQREFIRTKGISMLRGLRNLYKDLARGGGQLRISMTDTRAFELGKNVAVTPGKVVFQNEMMQLLQYQPTTAKVKKRPLLIVPPWINKYYILDLRKSNSFINWAVEQGHTVFVISWINPDVSYADKDFGDYVNGGVLAALDAIKQATGVDDVNAIGYCLGGTLLATTLAYMAATKDQRIKSATFFASLMDFSCPGELGVFIDEEQLQALDRRMERGYLDGSEMATTFNMLRANDLIWSFFVNNYLLGKEPFAFDLLYWNADSTRMPAAMHRFYLRNMYQYNRLREPGGITIDNVAIDLGQVKVPSYFLSTVDDHIAPWQATFEGPQLLQGKNRFVLGGSGHIAGVINPPRSDKQKYGFWTNDDLTNDAEQWFAGAKHNEGSWWPDWETWVAQLDNTQVAARKPGDGKLKIIEDAPGSYAKRRLD